MHKSITTFVERHYGAVLLVYIASYLLLEPFSEGSVLFYKVFYGQYLLLLVFGPYILTANRTVFIVSIVMVVLMLFAHMLAERIDAKVLDLISGYLMLTSLAYITSFMLWHSIQREHVTKQTIYASICIYLLIGMSFGNAYNQLHILYPGSFSLGDLGVSTERGVENKLLYFSFTTLTTLGYGDVLPTSPVARRLSSLESCIGIMYIALFVGRIIGLFKGQHVPNVERK